jgi:chromosomal replication initiation ATPase DnaA
MAEGLGYYPWSRHTAYLGNVLVLRLSKHWVLAQCSRQENRAIELYLQYVLAGKEFHQGSFEGRILDEENFIEEALARASQRVPAKSTLGQILVTVCSHYTMSLTDLSGRSRRREVAEAMVVAAIVVREAEHLSLMELSRKLNRGFSGLNQAPRRLERKMAGNARMSQVLSDSKDAIT